MQIESKEWGRRHSAEIENQKFQLDLNFLNAFQIVKLANIPYHEF